MSQRTTMLAGATALFAGGAFAAISLLGPIGLPLMIVGLAIVVVPLWITGNRNASRYAEQDRDGSVTARASVGDTRGGTITIGREGVDLRGLGPDGSDQHWDWEAVARIDVRRGVLPQYTTIHISDREGAHVELFSNRYSALREAVAAHRPRT